MNISIPERMKRLRLCLGLDQKGFADLLKVTQATVSRWEGGSVPKRNRIIQLAQLAGEPVDPWLASPNAETVSANDWYRVIIVAQRALDRAGQLEPTGRSYLKHLSSAYADNDSASRIGALARRD